MASVTLRHITKAFDGNYVIRDFNGEFQNGEFITLLGPSGCGKTTLLRLIAGFDKPTSGEILFNDQPVSGGKTFIPPERRNIGMVFQSYAVWPHMNVFDNVAYPLKIKKQDQRLITEKVQKVLETVHLTQYAARYPSQLSGGQQQRVALARALVAEPSLLLLDEPLSNLDAKLRETMRFEIKEIQSKLGITVVYVTHDQTEAMAMSDRIFLINGGEVQQVGHPTEIYNHPVNQFVADFLGKVVFLRGRIERGRLYLDDTEQSIPYSGDRTGRVEMAVRPERIVLSRQNGDLQGTLIHQFYLGDSNDCRVRVDGQMVRVIAPPETFSELKVNAPVYLSFPDVMYFDEDGSLEEKLKIMT